MSTVRTRLNRETVVDIAMRIGDAEGIDSVTLQRVANESGVTQPALYKHVTGVEELWKLMSLRGRMILADGLRTAVSGLTGDEAVLAAARAWREMARAHPGLYAATDRVPLLGDAEIETALWGVIDALSSSLDGYGLDDETRAHCARSLRSSLHGFVTLERDGGHPEPFAVDQSLDRLVSLFCAGLRSI